jgi:signal-transduction protein with cAMP-binding, CBS, and nucleotidyltransferase domain
MDALTFLSGHVPLFAGLSEEALTPLAEAATVKKFAAGQTVLHAGMSVESLHVVATGKVFVQAKVPGKGLVRVADLGLGEVFGEVSMLERSLATATVKAADGGAIVLLIPEEPFRRLAAENPGFDARVQTLIQARRAAPPSPAA